MGAVPLDSITPNRHGSYDGNDNMGNDGLLCAGQRKAPPPSRSPGRWQQASPWRKEWRPDALHELRSKHPGAAATTTVVYADLFRPVMEMVEVESPLLGYRR
ncbi:Os01g0223402 [Oryza sativa Japonica Group]|uniref:Os01g0223402 protein n=1 Tax=Oryza sativa subsp. japonica TaxID=39947 RepID=A0A0P0V0D9_ORYSJ|nr:Os01g0223402 [Oryza sativa Japonica Group]